MTTESWFHGRLRELTEDECLELLEAESVGRVAYCSEDGPVVIPVNFVLEDGAVLFRTSPDTRLAQHLRDGTVVGFEIDEADDYTQSGWSVLVRGPVSLLGPDEVSRELEERPNPWPEGGRSLYVRVSLRSVTGRRLLAV